MTNPKLFIRAKRRNQTYCLLCDADDTIATVKAQIQQAVAQHDVDNTDVDMRLLRNNENLPNDETLGQLNIVNDDVVHVVFAVADNEYESVDIIAPSADMQE